MDVTLKPKFIPEIQDEDIDISTTLFIFAQVVSENANSKNLLVNSFKEGDECIFDGVKDQLKEKLGIVLRIVYKEPEEFYRITMMSTRPDIIYLDDYLSDSELTQAMISTVPPFSFLISRGIKVEGFTKSVYCPLYAVGNGQNRVEMGRWLVQDVWEHTRTKSKVSIVKVKSESDFDEVAESVNNSTKYHKYIYVANYPDTLGLRKVVSDERLQVNKNHAYVVLTDTDVEEDILKEKLLSDLAVTVYNNGVWGGEYLVPVKNT